MQDSAVNPIPEMANPETEVFWRGTSEGKFLFRRCNSCGEPHFYPRSICPFCCSDDTDWETASGDATLYSFCANTRAKPPYTIAYVTLAEGPTVLTNLVDCDAMELTVGQAVSLTYREQADGSSLPVFRPT